MQGTHSFASLASSIFRIVGPDGNYEDKGLDHFLYTEESVMPEAVSLRVLGLDPSVGLVLDDGTIIFRVGDEA